MNDMSKTEANFEVDATAVPAPKASGTRVRLFSVFALVLIIGGGGYYAYDVLYASRHAITDNAYVGAEVAAITPLISGPVVEVLVGDTQKVRKGDVLVRIDDTDTRLQLGMAEANYQSALRKVRAYVASDRGLTAQVAGRVADAVRADAQLSSAEADHDKAKVDLERRQQLVAKGSVSGDELTAAETAFRVTEANLASAKAGQQIAQAAGGAAIGSREANAALIDGVSIEDNPQVLAARAVRDQAQVNQERTVIRSPIDGVVSRRQVQVGQRVQPETTLMVVVPLDQAYVDANFKEVQLAKVRAGQSVELTSDLYGDDVRFHGKVVGFSGGTGSAFSVVPAQNATGNWIKVVQRLPVRIELVPEELEAHPLSVGLSMTADIHLSE